MVIAGSGKAPRAMNGIKGGEDTGTRSGTAGNFALTTVPTIGRGDFQLHGRIALLANTRGVMTDPAAVLGRSMFKPGAASQMAGNGTASDDSTNN